jgi:acetyl esterase/lipase
MGDHLSMGWLDGPDLLAALDHLEGRPEVAPGRVGVVGLSAGGHIALNAAYFGLGRIAALWVDGIQAQGIADFPPPANAGERFATLINALILRLAELRLGRRAPPPFRQIVPALDAVPMTIVVGGAQEFERRVNEGYAAVAGPNVETWVIEGAAHLGGPLVDPEAYSRRMVAFFDAALR